MTNIVATTLPCTRMSRVTPLCRCRSRRDLVAEDFESKKETGQIATGMEDNHRKPADYCFSCDGSKVDTLSLTA